MKALVLVANGELELQEVPRPEPAEDECLLAVKGAGICNSDISRAYDGGAYFYPLIMGHEFCGVVEAIGSAVTKFKPGDRVAAFPLMPCNECEYCHKENYAQCVNYDYYGSRRAGAFAEFIAVREWNLFAIPQTVSFAEAALLEPVAVAFHALGKTSVGKTDSVAIFGAGIIGLALASYLLTNKVTQGPVFVIDHNEFKLSIAAGFGARTINPQRNDNWLQTLLKDTSGGVNLTIEACGAVSTFEQSLQVVKSHGNVLWLGNIRGDLLLTKQTVSSILRRELTLYGYWNSKYNQTASDDWHAALRFIEKNGLRELITHEVSLAEGPQVFARLKANRSKPADEKEPILKVVFKV